MNRTTRHLAGALGTCLALLIVADRAAAQEQQPPPDHSQMQMDMDMDMSSGWHFMQDGVLFGVFNHQGGPRGATEFKAPNWWMGQASRTIGSSRLTLNAMLSLDPATEGRDGYAELFQVGESLDGRPLVIVSIRTISSCSSRRSGACRSGRTGSHPRRWSGW